MTRTSLTREITWTPRLLSFRFPRSHPLRRIFHQRSDSAFLLICNIVIPTLPLVRMCPFYRTHLMCPRLSKGVGGLYRVTPITYLKTSPFGLSDVSISLSVILSRSESSVNLLPSPRSTFLKKPPLQIFLMNRHISNFISPVFTFVPFMNPPTTSIFQKSLSEYFYYSNSLHHRVRTLES